MTAGTASHDRRDGRLAVAALVGQSLFWGYNWVVMKVALQYSDPWPFTALRTSLGAVALFALLAALRRPLRPTQPLLTMVLGVLQTTGMVGLLVWALETGAAGRVSALVYTMPVWALIFGRIFLGERILGLQWVGAALSLVGLVLVLDPLHLAGTWQSKALAIGSGITWAVGAILVKVINRRGPVDVINLTAWQMLYGSIPIILIAVLVPSRSIEWSGEFIGALIYNIIPGTALPWLFWLFVLKVLPTGVAGISTLATPVIGIVAAAIQLGERVSVIEGVGMGCILAALLILTLQGLLRRGSDRRAAAAAAHARVTAPSPLRDEGGVAARPPEGPADGGA